MPKDHSSDLKGFASELLALAGVEINGSNPWDIQIHDEAFYRRVLNDGTLGLGESYMEKLWDCEALDQFFDRVIRAKLQSHLKSNLKMFLRGLYLKLVNLQTKTRSLEVGRNHYDLGNDLFQQMLDKEMNYTCGYWKNQNNLDDAQRDKLELVCQKMALTPGMRLLDIGCGFGSFAKYAASHYGVEVVGITISEEQCLYARKNCENLPVEIRFQDYREVEERFDRIVSLGMFEHVGEKNYLDYMQTVDCCLKEEGLFLLHTIGNNVSTITPDPWINRYIFPNGMIPSIVQIAKASEPYFVMEDWHNFGADYDKTLMAWFEHFNKNWPQLKGQYDERFYRMWRYYLLSCAGAFCARDLQLWQIVYSKQGLRGGYQAPRLERFGQ